MISWFQVAWMHFEQSAILTVHNHVITRNPRISVTHDKHRTWFLHISNVQEEDKGRYMCQINTVTAKTQFGYLHVVGKIYIEYFVLNKSEYQFFNYLFSKSISFLFYELSMKINMNNGTLSAQKSISKVR